MHTKLHSLKNSLMAIFSVITLFTNSLVFAQVKVGDNPISINPGSLIEMESTNKGLLMPRISLVNTTTWGLLGTAVAGMHIYNTNMAITSTNTLYPTLAAKIGEYYWDGTGWVALAPLSKNTAIFSFGQTTGSGVVINLPTASAFCGTLACATYLNWTGSFTTSKNVNDVVVDATGNYNLAFSTTSVQFNLFLAIDKTTPGVFETIGSFFVTQTGLACAGDYMNYKTVLQNLPPRTYTVRMYAAPWTNSGAPAKLGIGAPSNPGSCGGPVGSDLTNSQKLIISISQ